MSLEMKKLGDTLVVRVFGEFDLRSADYCRQEIDRTLKAEGAQSILFDLGGVSFIDSSGLGVILGRYRKAKENGWGMAISNVPPAIAKVLELAGITRLLPVYSDNSQALKDLARRVK